MSSLRTRIRPDVSTSSIGGQRLRMACASRSPSMLPGMLMSVKTIRMSFRRSRRAMASSALPASSTPKPASSRRDTAFIRTNELIFYDQHQRRSHKTPRRLGPHTLWAHRTERRLRPCVARSLPNNVFGIAQHGQIRGHSGEHPAPANSSTDFSRLMRHWPHDLLCRFVLALLPFPALSAGRERLRQTGCHRTMNGTPVGKTCVVTSAAG